MRRWVVVAIFFVFLLLHQSDRLLIGPLTTPIMAEFGLNEAQMGAALSGALLVAVLLFPLWGYLFDRFARARLLAVASFIWGGSTWLSALAPTYPAFLAARASTGIDDSTYPGIYSLLADYFGPEMRSKVYAILQLTAPLGFLISTTLALLLREAIGWRGVFLLTGALGLLVAGLIAVQASLHMAILQICVGAWLLCALFFVGAALRVPVDVAALHRQLRDRAEALYP